MAGMGWKLNLQISHIIYPKTKCTHAERGKERDMGKICKAEITVHKIILYCIMLMEERILTNSMQKEHLKDPRIKDRIISDDWKNCDEQSQTKADYFSIPHITLY